jgi:hypothetical protein
MHSFRHGWKTAARSVMSEELHDAITGHSNGSVGRAYGNVPLKALAEAMAKVRFGGDRLAITPRRASIVSGTPPGSDIWLAEFEKGFVAALNSADCEKAAKSFSRSGESVPSCRQAWIRMKVTE